MVPAEYLMAEPMTQTAYLRVFVPARRSFFTLIKDLRGARGPEGVVNTEITCRRDPDLGEVREGTKNDAGSFGVRIQERPFTLGYGQPRFLESFVRSDVGFDESVASVSQGTDGKDLEVISDDGQDRGRSGRDNLFVDSKHDEEHHDVGEGAACHDRPSRIDGCDNSLANDEVAFGPIHGKQETEQKQREVELDGTFKDEAELEVVEGFGHIEQLSQSNPPRVLCMANGHEP